MCPDLSRKEANLVGFGVGSRGRFRERTGLSDRSAEKFAVEFGDESDADRFGTDGFALILIAAGTKAFTVHGGDHGFGALLPLRPALRQRGKV
jgi:hypothetical protein